MLGSQEEHTRSTRDTEMGGGEGQAAIKTNELAGTFDGRMTSPGVDKIR